MLNFILFVDLMMTCLFPQVDFHLGPRCWTLSCLWTWWWLVCSHRLISISVLDAELYLVCGLDDDLFVPTGWFPSRSKAEQAAEVWTIPVRLFEDGIQCFGVCHWGCGWYRWGHRAHQQVQQSPHRHYCHQQWSVASLYFHGPIALWVCWGEGGGGL